MYLNELFYYSKTSTVLMFTFALIYLIRLYIPTTKETVLLNSETLPVLENSSLCLTEQCFKEAKFYQSNMNETVDPCDDFYEFACGNFIKNHAKLPSTVYSVNPFSKEQDAITVEISKQVKEKVKPSDSPTLKKIKTYYQSCINTTRIEKDGTRPLLELLESIGGWPIVTGNNWDKSKFDLMNSLQKLKKKNYPISFPFEVDVDHDPVDVSYSVLIIKSPTLTYDRAFLVDDSILPEAYLNFIRKSAIILGADELVAYQEAIEIMKFESELYQVSQTSLDDALYLPIKHLSDIISTIPWLELFNMLLNPSEIYIDKYEPIVVQKSKIFLKLAELLDKTPKRILVNYFGWTIVQNSMPYLPEKLRLLQVDFMNIVRGTSGNKSRELLCIENVKEKMSIGISSIYVKNYFDRKIKNNVQDMFVLMKNQMRKNLKKVDWMDKEARQRALEKLEAMRANIAYADELLDNKKIDEYYRELKIKSPNFLRHSLEISMFKLEQTYQSLLDKQGKYNWKKMQSSVVANGFYYPASNLVDISAALLLGPFYQYNRPQYLNFGATGTTLGHEITHAFTVNVRMFDKNAKFKAWRDYDATQKYREIEKCFVDQYNDFMVRDVNLTVNGKRTKIENIADNGGIKTSYYAYIEWIRLNGKEPSLPGLDYTPKQMFWISAGNNWCSVQRSEYLSYLLATSSHSPKVARVNVVFSNTPEFAKDFQCKKGTKMNPKKRCILW